MLAHPQFDPVAISLGPISVHWYGLMYLFAFAQFWWLGKRRLHTLQPTITTEQLDDLLFFGAIGVILGGRLGQVLFYEPGHFLNHPLEILMIWRGGMSFHGGFLGVLAGMAWWASKHQRTWLDTTDFIAPLVPLGLMFGRIGNFINGEIWGRVADASLPWAMTFPQAGDQLPRHPAQLYHAGLEGLLLFVLLWLYARRERPRGAISGAFLIGYGAFRFIVEYFREPDAGIFGRSYTISMGQWLSLPMVLAGIALLWVAYRKR